MVSSWVQARWVDVTSSLDSAQWQWGRVPTAYRRLWDELGGDPILSACVKIQLDLDDIRENTKRFKARCFGLQYEDLIPEPESSGRWPGSWDWIGPRLQENDRGQAVLQPEGQVEEVSLGGRR